MENIVTNYIKNYGFTTKEVQEYEKENRKVARLSAEESIVLLKNEKVLPFKRKMNIGLFGSGATKTIKGGTGSGNVNERYSVSVYEGLKNVGQAIVSDKWIEKYNQVYNLERENWKEQIKKRESSDEPFVLAYFDTPFNIPAEPLITNEDIEGSDIFIYVISREAGEGYDRKNVAGDFKLSNEEYKNLAFLNQQNKPIIVILNVGGTLDLTFIKEFSEIKGIFNMSFAGEEGGNALADLITGVKTPSGHLADTFSFSYEDWPSAYSVEKATDDRIEYNEDIYVGYKWFDAYPDKVAFPFGFGMSYTEFETIIKSIKLENTTVSIEVETINSGNEYSGKDVKQVYCLFPEDGELKREQKRLVAFMKTDLISPHGSDTQKLTFDLSQLSSFDEKESKEVIEKGLYTIAYGENAQKITPIAQIEFKDTFYSEKKEGQLNNPDTLEKKIPHGETILIEDDKTLTRLTCQKNPLQKPKQIPCTDDVIINTLIDDLEMEDKLKLVVGRLGKNGTQVGGSTSKVYAASGETATIKKDGKVIIEPIVLCDGPAGLRLTNMYQVDYDGKPIQEDVSVVLDQKAFPVEKLEPEKQIFYRYCTAFPVGSCLAQSWNREIIKEVGVALSKEMNLFGIDIWLAPGMNIHRYPLCGRNFEYFSEDPLLSGHLAAAIVNGVQKDGTKGATIKHFACNNQETNRMSSNSIVSERALRELYLKNFEYCLQITMPVCIMSSYNEINNIHLPNNSFVLDKVLREEFCFDGLVMTDWTTTTFGGASAYGCMIAMNSLIMPGDQKDVDNIKVAIDGHKITIKQLEENVYQVIKVVKRLKS